MRTREEIWNELKDIGTVQVSTSDAVSLAYAQLQLEVLLDIRALLTDISINTP